MLFLKLEGGGWGAEESLIPFLEHVTCFISKVIIKKIKEKKSRQKTHWIVTSGWRGDKVTSDFHVRYAAGNLDFFFLLQWADIIANKGGKGQWFNFRFLCKSVTL